MKAVPNMVELAIPKFRMDIYTFEYHQRYELGSRELLRCSLGVVEKGDKGEG